MYQDETPVASIFTVNAPDGYSGNIELIVGIYADQSLAGVRVINHNETPGLGDKIEKQKSDWILQFKGLSLTKVEAENWRVKKDGGTFDAFTGATITPRAVLKAIANALQYFKNNQQIIFTSSKNCGVNHEST
jgi:electron transport complex protein RnfG